MQNHDTRPAFPYKALRTWIVAILMARTLPEEDAILVAEGLLDADLREVSTHGLAQLPAYLALLDKGTTNPRPEIRTTGSNALLHVAADRALGQVAGMRAINALVPAARAAGLAGATIADAGHLGGLGHFVRHAAEQGLIAIVMQNGPPLMGLPGSTNRAIGNNPIAFGAPVPGGPPILFDISASTAAYGKILSARAAGESIPDNWALDSNGQGTTDAEAAAQGMLLPIAGPKGIGLAMMVEVLAGSLSGTKPVFGGNIFGGFVMLIDPLAVMDRAGYETHMADWIAQYRQSGPEARYPGERAAQSRERQMKSGIRLDEKLVSNLIEIAESAGFDLPLQTTEH